MAKIFCSSTGSNTAPYETWAKAATSFANALAQATVAGDVVAVDATNPPAAVVANTTWQFAANIHITASTNSGTDTITPTTMGFSTWLGYSASSAFSLTLQGAFSVTMYGLTFRMGSASSTLNFTCGNSDGSNYAFDSSTFWLNAGASSALNFGLTSAGFNHATKLVNSTIRFGAIGQVINVRGSFEGVGGGISSAGVAPTTLFAGTDRTTTVRWAHADLSHVTGTLVGNQASSSCEFHFIQPKLGSGVTILATQSVANLSSGSAWIYDGASDGTDGRFEYHNALGSIITDSSIKFTGSAAGQSWKIITTANASGVSPFITPSIDLFHDATSSITPRLEILRDGSATAYTDAEVWGEFVAKITSGAMPGTLYNDRQALADLYAGTAGTAQAAGSDTWDGENATHWAGKVDSGAALTPAEPGAIRGRLVVAVPSVSDLYLDPFIRF